MRGCDALRRDSRYVWLASCSSRTSATPVTGTCLRSKLLKTSCTPVMCAWHSSQQVSRFMNTAAPFCAMSTLKWPAFLHSRHDVTCSASKFAINHLCLVSLAPHLLLPLHDLLAQCVSQSWVQLERSFVHHAKRSTHVMGICLWRNITYSRSIRPGCYKIVASKLGVPGAGMLQYNSTQPFGRTFVPPRDTQCECRAAQGKATEL